MIISGGMHTKSTTGNNDGLLHQLTIKARQNGLKIDQSALAYSAGNRIKFYGDKNLVSYLSKAGLPQWTHKLTL